MNNKWQCKIDPLPKKITVGQKFYLVCKGEQTLSFKKPLSIKGLDSESAYSLYILKTVRQEENFLVLEATSYRTGLFNKTFFISDGEQKALVDNLSFLVQSVLPKTKQTLSPHGSFGPFRDPLPLGYWLSFSFSCLFLGICLFWFVRRLWQRQSFIKKIQHRKGHLQPSKSFVQGLRKLEYDSPEDLKSMEALFQKFLEDLFFIPAFQIDPKNFIKNLKRRYPQTYKKEGTKIQQILKEFLALKEKPLNRKNLKKLHALCQEVVFRLDNKNKVRN